jgi:hypothetical protein
VYNPVNLSVSPSYYIQTAAWLVIAVTLVVLAFQPLVNVFILLPSLVVIAWYGYRLSKSQFVFQRKRYWQLSSSELYLWSKNPAISEKVDNNRLKVKLIKTQIFHSLVLFSYRIESKVHHEIISIDTVDREVFRQFRCMLKSL